MKAVYEGNRYDTDKDLRLAEWRSDFVVEVLYRTRSGALYLAVSGDKFDGPSIVPIYPR